MSLKITIRLGLVFFVIGSVIGLASLHYIASLHQTAAEHFWGEDYDPARDNAAIDYGYLVNLMMPEGGPLIATSIVQVCFDTPLPMVPIKLNPEGKGQVLCGIGPDSIVSGFKLENIEDEEIREAIKRIVSEEFSDSN